MAPLPAVTAVSSVTVVASFAATFMFPYSGSSVIIHKPLPNRHTRRNC